MNPTYDKKAAKRRRMADIEEQLMLRRYPYECKDLGCRQITNEEKNQLKTLCCNSTYLEKEMMKRKMCKSNIKINLDNYNIIKICFSNESDLQAINQSKRKFCNLVESLSWELYLDSPVLDKPIFADCICDVLNISTDTVLNLYYPKEHEEIILTLFAQWRYKDYPKWEEKIINGKRR